MPPEWAKLFHDGLEGVARVARAIDADKCRGLPARRFDPTSSLHIARGTTLVTAATPTPRPDGESHDDRREPCFGSSPDHGAHASGAAALTGGTDEAAFTALYAEHYERLCRFARRYLRSAQSAEELVHDVFLRLWVQRTHSGAAELPLPARAYLYAAVRNAAVDVLRRARSEQRALERAGQSTDADWDGAKHHDGTRVLAAWGSDTEVDVLDLVASIQRAIDELPARPREVLLLKWRDGLSNGEVAMRLGLALKTVEMHVTRAFASLREALLPLMRRSDRR